MMLNLAEFLISRNMDHSSRITGSERPLNKLLTDDFEFVLPPYQRPYAWDVDEAVTMLTDLSHESAKLSDETEISEASPYFLGSLVLIKPDKSRRQHDVVDGQQRLITLTILLSVLRDQLSEVDGDEKLATGVGQYVATDGDETTGTKTSYRVNARKNERDFFETYVQTAGGTLRLSETTLNGIEGEGKERMLRVARALVGNVAALSKEERRRLTLYILRNCYVITVVATDKDLAFRMFLVLNDRGLNLNAADILKSDIIGEHYAFGEQNEAAEKWDAIEDGMGRDSFLDLFSHVRMIFQKRQISNVLREFQDDILPSIKKGEFIESALQPYAKLYQCVLDAGFKAASEAERINQQLKRLHLLSNDDWIPVAMELIRIEGGRPDVLAGLLDGLERVAAYMLLGRTGRPQRAKRYGLILSWLQEGAAASRESFDGSPLDLDEDEISEARQSLAGSIYKLTNKDYILRRLDEVYSDTPAIYERPRVTVEHVMPQKPSAESDWTKLGSLEERELEVHRLGNLVLLSKSKNSSAKNWDFAKKKEKYFFSGGKTTSFSITNALRDVDHWDLEVIRERTKDAATRLAELWRLDR